jgi:hypothetical protein
MLMAVMVTLTFSSLGVAEAGKMNRIVGVKIYDYRKDFGILFSQWRVLGINNAFISVDLARNREFRRLAKANGILTWIILPVFYNPEKLKQDPNLYAQTAAGEKAVKDWVQFVCPSRTDYRAERLEFIRRLLQECQPDGLSIDFIRFFVYWETMYPGSTPDPHENTCFCARCIRDFSAFARLQIPEQFGSVRAKAEWIMKYRMEEWSRWKCQTITSMVASIADEARKIQPGILLNVHALPWRDNDFDQAWKTVAGQDVAAISLHVDYISPMCYAHMVKQEPSWIHSVALDIQKRSSKPILVSIQVSDEGEDRIPTELFKDYLDQALAPPSAGVVIWNWEMLDQHPEKQQIVKTVLRGLE